MNDLVTEVLEISELDDPYTVYVTQVDYQTYKNAEEENVTIGHHLMDSITDVPDNELFDDAIIDKIIKENNKHIIKREAKEEKQDTNADKQTDKKETQEQKKDSNADKQMDKKETQEQKKDSNADKQNNKKDNTNNKNKDKAN